MAEPCKTNAHIKTIPYFGRNGLYKMLRSLQMWRLYTVLLSLVYNVYRPHYSNLKNTPGNMV